ncbi:Hypothetical protein SRAE_1000312100 [Strongyloides ratti]|uniref:Uncharacterized protein n=1 Tax=Strongyloides ratti TaxID=34506 RepID=A0A090L9Q2_STRRB|nr:Hypothetical protein SRAE_1000312100 [Strongyloides ratti]CEF64868.1 Hypothetical protein SRAE_1000312100 [Strongyloides ratti]
MAYFNENIYKDFTLLLLIVMIILKITFIFLFLYSVCQVNTIWIGEEYWTSIDKFGNILDGRTTDDFVTIDTDRSLKNPNDKIFIAFWILKDPYGHHEAFGTARILGPGKICGTFLNRQNTSENLCGGFRVLSRNKMNGVNPFEFVPITQVIKPYAVTYRKRHPARIYSYNKYENFIGTANLRNRVVWGIESDLTIIKVEEASTYDDYVQNIEILIKNPSLEQIDSEMLARLRQERENAEKLRRLREEEEKLKKGMLLDEEIHNLKNDNEPAFRHRKRL